MNVAASEGYITVDGYTYDTNGVLINESEKVNDSDYEYWAQEENNLMLKTLVYKNLKQEVSNDT